MISKEKKIVFKMVKAKRYLGKFTPRGNRYIIWLSYELLKDEKLFFLTLFHEDEHRVFEQMFDEGILTREETDLCDELLLDNYKMNTHYFCIIAIDKVHWNETRKKRKV